MGGFDREESAGEPLLGRDDELTRIDVTLERVRQGEQHLLALRGEAGVGKTRLLAATIDRARATGFRVMHARADDFDRHVPFAALRLAVEPDLRGEASPRLGEPSRQLVEAFEVGRGHRQHGSTQPAQVMQLLYRVMRGWVEQRPVLLAIDDIQCADADTVAALGFLGRHVGDRLLVAVALRFRPPDLDVGTAHAVDRMTASGRSTVIEVEPLTPDDVRALVAARLGAEPTAGVAAQIWDATQGNSFFTVELIRALAESGHLVAADDGRVDLDDQAPMIVNDSSSLLHRLFRLGPVVEAVSRTIAVLPEVSVDDLTWVAKMTGHDEVEVITAFDTLVRAGVLTATATGHAFAHPIVRDTVYDHLGPAERQRLHRSVVELRLAQRDVGRSVDVADIARHLRLAGGADPATSTIFVEAGDAAITQAPWGALGWYEDALQAMPDNSVARGQVLSKRARALSLVSRNLEAAEVAAEALALLEPGPVFRRTIELRFTALQRGGEFREALDLLDEFMDDPSVMTPRLLAQRGQVLLWFDRLDEGQRVLDEAAQIAGGEGDPGIDGARLNMLWTVGRTDEARALDDRMRARLDDVTGIRRLGVLVALASGSAYNGRRAKAAAALAELEGRILLPGTVAAARVYERMLSGEWDDVVAIGTEEIDRVDGDYALRPLIMAALVNVLAERDEVEAARAIGVRIEREPVFVTTSLVARAHADLAAGELDRARSLAVQTFNRKIRIGRLGNIASAALLLVDIEMAAERPDAAATVVDRLAQQLPANPNDREAAMAGIARAITHRDADAASAAVTAARRDGLAFELARSLHLRGELRGDGDDVIEAIELYRKMKVPGRERDAARLLRQLGRRMPRSAVRDGELTPAERQLAELVGAGLTNRQIADELFLSPKTVEVYLTRLYAKVGCSSRVDLAVALSSGRI